MGQLSSQPLVTLPSLKIVLIIAPCRITIPWIACSTHGSFYEFGTVNLLAVLMKLKQYDDTFFLLLGIPVIKITMPALSPTMEEGNIVKWLKTEGKSELLKYCLEHWNILSFPV